MKNLVPFIQGFTLFSALSWLSHLGAAYALLRLGVVWSFLIIILSCLIYGLCLLAKGFFGQSAGDNPSLSLALIYLVPSVVLLIIVIVAAITGVITGL